MLEKELKIFEENKTKLAAENPNGGFAVIKDDKILGVWNDRQDALRAGVEEWGNVQFLVKDITQSNNHVNYFSRNIIFAD